MAVGGAEEHFAKKLAHNDKRIRDRTVRRLQAWIASRKQDGVGFKERDLLKIWKGLFYCFWMSDKPLVQEELASSISSLIHSFRNKDSALLFLVTFFKTMHREWHGIDRLRMDKFYMLVRMMVKQMFVMMIKNKWEPSLCDRVCANLKEGPLHPTAEKVPVGMRLHLASIYLDELKNTSECQVPEKMTLKLLEPFLNLAAFTKNQVIFSAVKTGVLDSIYSSQQNIKTNTENNNDEAEEKDLEIDCLALADKLFAVASDREVLSRNRHVLYSFVKRFKKLKSGHTGQPNLNVDSMSDSNADMETGVKRRQETQEVEVSEEVPKKKRKKKQKVVSNTSEKDLNNDDISEMAGKEAALSSQKMNANNLEILVDGDSQSSLEAQRDTGHKNSKVSKRNKRKQQKDSVLENGVSDSHKSETEACLSTRDIVMEDDNAPKQTDGAKEEKPKKKQKINGKSEFSESKTDSPMKESVTEVEAKADVPEVDGFVKAIRDKISDKQDEPKTASKTPTKSKSLSKPKTLDDIPFAFFKKTNTTPKAYVKKQVPLTEPKKGSKQEKVPVCPDSAPQGSRKKVRIALSKNTAHTHQDYANSLKESPTIPFDAERSPSFGLLKAKSVLTPSPSAPARNTRSQRNRPNASDFF
ncbi:predicted protein [Nematostella vectensis]|uniref:Uncharacterized protein n=1 Tax=Nematostella vectensis TaxID=45351 RepID=A7RR02_NEMVE|nr:predicted protein [Nematostella vectensis]|eukprot:XP_001638145.1 predicted protein [Nematostella vectensis]